MTPPFIPYYIDYNVKNQSKTIGISKKKITFKFGFANREAVDNGMVGAHCRGSEHEVVFTWSLVSGKRHVTLDGKDVHFSTSGQNGWTSDRTWQHVFSLKVPSYAGTFRCHLISQPAPQGSNIRPFDLRVGGVSIFKFNQIYQLGTPQMSVRKPGGHRMGHGGSGDDEPMSPEERRMLAAARVESMKEYKKEQDRHDTEAHTAGAQNGSGPPAAAPTGEVDLLMSFDGPPSAPPIPPPQGNIHQVSSLTIGSDFRGSTASVPAVPFGAPPPGQDFRSSANSFASAPPPGQSPYGYPPQQQQQQQPGYPQPAQYGQAPPQQQHNPFGGSFTQQSAGPMSTNSYGGASAMTSPTANTTAMTPYQAPTGQAQSTPGYSLGANSFSSSFNTAPTQASTQAPAPSLSNSMDPYAKPPADPFASPAAAPPQQQQQSYGQVPPQQQQQPSYGGFPAVQSPTAETVGTYGSAPTFARPPQAQQQQQYQQPQGGYGQPGQPPAPYGQAPAYGQQPPAPAGNAYAPPAQYQQQQQQSFTGF